MDFSVNLPMQNQEQHDIIIGYFGVRAKTQVSRLLCEFLGIKCIDKVFTQKEWQLYKENEAKTWVFQDLPFLRHKEFVVIGENAMKEYIIRYSKNDYLLGNSLKDILQIDTYKGRYDLKDSIMALLCSSMTKDPANKPLHLPEHYWSNVIQPRLKELQQNAMDNNWYFGYITIIDFNLYELMNCVLQIFSNLKKCYPKLTMLREKVRSIPAIEYYESSKKFIKAYSPVVLVKGYEPKSTFLMQKE